MRWPRRRDRSTSEVPTGGARARAWITATAREVAPASIVTQVAERASLPTGELVSFDGRSAAIELRIPSVADAQVHGAHLRLSQDDRGRIIATVEALHLHPDVIDVSFETHLVGDEDVRSERTLTHHQLIAELRQGEVLAGVRYLTD